MIRSGLMPNAWARLPRTLSEPWLESWTVRWPSDHSAVAACGSMGWLCSASIRYVASVWTGRVGQGLLHVAPVADGGEPAVGLLGRVQAGVVLGEGDVVRVAFVLDVSSPAPVRAASSESAITRATGMPWCGTRSSWSTARIGSSGSWSRGALSWVRTEWTPGTARASTARTAVTRPAATVAGTVQAYRQPAGMRSAAYRAVPVTLSRASLRTTGAPGNCGACVVMAGILGGRWCGRAAGPAGCAGTRALGPVRRVRPGRRISRSGPAAAP